MPDVMVLAYVTVLVVKILLQLFEKVPGVT